MERINKKYVMLDKIDLLCSLNDEIENIDVIKNILSCISNYEKENKDYVGNFYLSVDSLYYSELSKIFDFQIKRNSILNAFIYAGHTKNLQMIFNLNSFLSYNEVSINKLGNLSDYVLEHSINFNEYIDGQEKKLVFDEEKGFYEDYIYGNSGIQKKLK
ncbi:MAG: hypothetical protein ACI31V_01155 [Bacilli bacterium]